MPPLYIPTLQESAELKPRFGHVVLRRREGVPTDDARCTGRQRRAG